MVRKLLVTAVLSLTVALAAMAVVVWPPATGNLGAAAWNEPADWDTNAASVAVKENMRSEHQIYYKLKCAKCGGLIALSDCTERVEYIASAHREHIDIEATLHPCKCTTPKDPVQVNVDAGIDKMAEVIKRIIKEMDKVDSETK